MPEKKEGLLRSKTTVSQRDPFEQSFRPGNALSGKEESPATSGKNPLKDLKAEVLSIDWEITDKVMTRFINQVERLKETYKNDRILVVFLKLLDSIGKYVKNNKGESHPDAIRLLNSVYNSLEEVLQLKGATEEEREKVLSIEVQRFKRLKAQIAQRSTTEARKSARPTIQTKAKEDEKDTANQERHRSHSTPQGELVGRDEASQNLLVVFEELKEFMRAEFEALRAELRLLKEGAQSGPKTAS